MFTEPSDTQSSARHSKLDPAAALPTRVQFLLARVYKMFLFILSLVARCSSCILPLQPETQHCRFSCGLGIRRLQTPHEAEHGLHFASLTCLRCVCRHQAKNPVSGPRLHSACARQDNGSQAAGTTRSITQLQSQGSSMQAFLRFSAPLHQRKRFRNWLCTLHCILLPTASVPHVSSI